MSTTALLPRRRGRRPRLKVVGGEPKLRHQVNFHIGDHLHYAVEFWTEQEWGALAEHERPDGGALSWLAGVGVFHVRNIDREESEEISDAIAAVNASHASIRGHADN
jgi:hypothetical protein